MINILIAPDKFKQSLDSFGICEAIEKGLRAAEGTEGPGRGQARFHIEHLPLADGGDGWLDIIRHYRPGTLRETPVRDPLFRTISSSWLLSADGKTAFIEMARASGLRLLKPAEYDCSRTSTYGTGQLIAEATRAGVEEVIIGIGGSATNDGGIGMAAALGVKFLDAAGAVLEPVGGNLIRLARIEMPEKPVWGHIRFSVAADVHNPLYGAQGATRIYGPHKGASPEMVAALETGMEHYASVLRRQQGMDIADRPGAGAAGGLGAGCMAFLGARLVSGVELLMSYSRAEEKVRVADWVITAEGKIDGQTLQGKLVAGIAALAKRHQKPAIAFCGELDLFPDELTDLGIRAAFSILNRPLTLEEAIRDGPRLLTETATHVGHLLLAATSPPF